METFKPSETQKLFVGGVLAFAVIGFGFIAVWMFKAVRTKSATHNNGVSESVENLRRLLEHPTSKASFNAGYQLGSERKASGLSKHTDRELDALFWPIIQKQDAPDDVRGAAMNKFKNGYGLGYLNGK